MLEQAPGQKLFSEELHPRGRTHAGTALQEGWKGGRRVRNKCEVELGKEGGCKEKVLLVLSSFLSVLLHF